MPRSSLATVDSLTVDVISDNVSDTYASKPAFAVSELANVMLAGASEISGQTLLVANLGYGLRLRSRLGTVEHVLLFDTGTEGAAFIRNCRNLAIDLGEVEEIVVTHGHWDHMGGVAGGTRLDRRAGAAATAWAFTSIPACSTNAACCWPTERSFRLRAYPRHRRWRCAARGSSMTDGSAPARRPFLLQWRDSARHALRDRTQGPSLPLQQRRGVAARPLPDGRAHARRECARPGPGRPSVPAPMPVSSMSARKSVACFPRHPSMR